MATRALPDLIARIRVDSSGVDAGMQNLIGSFGRANLALAGLGVGIGILITGGKSMIDISEKHSAATSGLDQAYKSAGLALSKYQAGIDAFITSNRRYISDQSEVIDGYAKLTRSGLTQKEVQRAMNDAVDLAALKHISLSDAVTLLDNAEHGRMRGLIDLGITTAKYTDAQGNLVVANHSVAQSMAELDAKLKGGRDTLTETHQASNRLSNDWQDVANRGGPQLVNALNAIENSVAAVYEEFDKLGKDDAMWATIDKRLVDMAKWIKTYIIDPINAVNKVLDQPFLAGGNNPGHVNPGRAGGGPVIPGGIYDIGEGGPEKLLMYPGGGGMVIPNGQSAGGSTTLLTTEVPVILDSQVIGRVVDRRVVNQLRHLASQ